MVEPEAGEVETVPWAQSHSVLSTVTIVRIGLGVRTHWVYGHPVDIRNVRTGERDPVSVLSFFVGGGGEVFVRYPGQVSGRLQDDVFISSHNTVNVLVRVLVHCKLSG